MIDCAIDGLIVLGAQNKSFILTYRISQNLMHFMANQILCKTRIILLLKMNVLRKTIKMMSLKV